MCVSRSPEELLGMKPDEKVDLWGLGCIMAELWNRKPIFRGSNYFDQLKMIFEMRGWPKPSDTEWITVTEAKQWIDKSRTKTYAQLLCLESTHTVRGLFSPVHTL